MHVTPFDSVHTFLFKNRTTAISLKSLSLRSVLKMFNVNWMHILEICLEHEIFSLYLTCPVEESNTLQSAYLRKNMSLRSLIKNANFAAINT